MIFSSDDLDTMARTLWAEARGEPQTGQIAVAWVIRNRAERMRFAGNLVGQVGAIEHVCTAPWQFSCWNEGGIESQRERLLTLSPVMFAIQRNIAAGVLGAALDPTGGADSYFTAACPPDAEVWPPAWAASMRFCGAFGHQLFYDSRVNDTQHVAHAGMPPGGNTSAIQEKLGLKVDGIYGPITRAAVEKYQSENGLTVDGVAGPKTLASLGII